MSSHVAELPAHSDSFCIVNGNVLHYTIISSFVRNKADDNCISAGQTLSFFGSASTAK